MAKKELFSDVDELVSSLNKELGEGSIMNFGDDTVSYTHLDVYKRQP